MSGGSALNWARTGVVRPLGNAAPPVECPSTDYPTAAEYSFERCRTNGVPAGWSRCEHLTYAVDAGQAPAGYRNDVLEAITQLEAASGLRLVESAGRANITISWDASLYDPGPGTHGEAGVTHVRFASSPSGSAITSASVRISSHLLAGTAAHTGEEPVLLHELGHAVGLGHHAGAVVMNPVDQGFSHYLPGDLAGLAALYHPGACTS